jgi:hypothetical protein
MRYVKSFALFWYDFVVGDDWTVAVGVVLALACTALLAHAGIAAWWLMPVAVVGLLAMSMWRLAARPPAGEAPSSADERPAGVDPGLGSSGPGGR